MPAPNLVAMTDDHLERARRAMLDDIYEYAGYVREQLDDLRQQAWPPGVITEDVQASKRELLRMLGAMDALGWPTAQRRTVR